MNCLKSSLLTFILSVLFIVLSYGFKTEGCWSRTLSSHIFVLLSPLQDNEDAEQYFSLTTNHSCWDWVRRSDKECEGEE